MNESNNEPIGPQRAAQQALEVEATAMPDGHQQANGAQPDGAPQPQIDPMFAWRTTLTQAFTLAFVLLKKKWKSFEPNEQDIPALVEVWTPICASRWPYGVPPEWVAVGTTMFIFGPKIMGAIGEERAKRQAASDAESAAKSVDAGTQIA